MRLSAVLNVPPLSHAALDNVSEIAAAADRAVSAGGPERRIYLTGATAEMIDMRAMTQQDFRRIALMALGAILLVVTLVLRDFLLSVFILAATALSYLTTLGLTCWVFESLGAHGMEWKVQMLLFIVLVAVGQDYSIFFAMRLAQESRQLPCAEATQRALIFTGPVISSCGLIMAATLGSVMAGDVQVLRAVGRRVCVGDADRHVCRSAAGAARVHCVDAPHASRRCRAGGGMKPRIMQFGCPPYGGVG